MERRRISRRALWAGMLVAGALWFAIGPVIYNNRKDENGQKTDTVTTVTTVTQTTPTQTTTTTTTTQPAGPTISQVQAKAAARQAASNGVERFGITIPPRQWDARCVARGGGDQAQVWSCQMGANGGQCVGTVEVFAKPGGGAGTRRNQIGCGE